MKFTILGILVMIGSILLGTIPVAYDYSINFAYALFGVVGGAVLLKYDQELAMEHKAKFSTGWEEQS